MIQLHPRVFGAVFGSWDALRTAWEALGGSLGCARDAQERLGSPRDGWEALRSVCVDHFVYACAVAVAGWC